MITAMIALFVLGYLGIALEHVLKINKATFALLLCVLLWTIYALVGHDPNLASDLTTALGDTCEIVVFLIGAMTIVELIDRYGGFNYLVSRISARSKRGCGWTAPGPRRTPSGWYAARQRALCRRSDPPPSSW